MPNKAKIDDSGMVLKNITNSAIKRQCNTQN